MERKKISNSCVNRSWHMIERTAVSFDKISFFHFKKRRRDISHYNFIFHFSANKKRKMKKIPCFSIVYIKIDRFIFLNWTSIESFRLLIALYIYYSAWIHFYHTICVWYRNFFHAHLVYSTHHNDCDLHLPITCDKFLTHHFLKRKQ